MAMTIFRLKVKIVVQLTLKQKIVVQSTVKSNGKKIYQQHSLSVPHLLILFTTSCNTKKICKILMHHRTQNKSFLRSDG